MSISYPIKSPKHPDAILPYTHDFAADLLDAGANVGDYILPMNHVDVTKRPTVVPILGTATVDRVDLSGAKVLYWVTGGKSHTQCAFKITVWTFNNLKITIVTTLEISNR